MATLGELTTRRQQLVDQLEAIVNDDNGKPKDDFSEDEELAFNTVDEELKALDTKIERTKRILAKNAELSKPVEEEKRDNKTSNGNGKFYAQAKQPEEKGAGFARIVACLAASRGIPHIAAYEAQKRYGSAGDRIAAALAAGEASAGGFLVPDEYSNEIIELLRNRAIVRGTPGLRNLPLNGSLLVPRHTGTATGGYLGENQNITKSQPTFGQIQMIERKLACLVPISNDLVRNSSPQVDMVVRDDLVQSLQTTEDQAFIYGTGVGNLPKGLRYWANSTTPADTTGSTTADKVENDIRTAINALTSANVNLANPVWYMAPRSRNYLAFVRDANGNLMFPEVRSNNQLLGWPIRESNQIPTNLGGGTATDLFFVEGSEMVLAEATGIIIDASTEAAFHDGSAVQAAFSLDQTVIRAIARHDFAVRHPEAVHVITGITWGA